MTNFKLERQRSENFDIVGELLIFLVVKLAKIVMKVFDIVCELLIFLVVILANTVRKIVVETIYNANKRS